ncbi:hypothetical protein [Sphingomonas faeni]|uniref:hypothetical protein n=1 Tax=Sphingomonas faeni TaxID=185950 RepID=UPI00335FFA6E
MLTNRSANSCATCRHWQRMGPKLANAQRDPSCAADEGTCERRAPSVVQGNSPFPVSMFPVTHESRGCGEWVVRAGAGGGPDDGERVGPGGGIDNTVVPLRRVA